MLEKRITFGDVKLFANFDKQDDLRKFASENSISQELIDKVNEISQKKRFEKSVIAVVIAVTEWETYGANDNSDSFHSSPFGDVVFPVGTLLSKYETFVSDGHVFRYHQSNNVADAIGDIHYAEFNQDQGRVELIIEIDFSKAAVECRKIKRGQSLNVSMGCRLGVRNEETGDVRGADYCSYCGHKATKPDEHCDHIKYQLGKVIDGVPVFMINSDMTFFDLSVVIIPGDMNAKVVYTPETEDQIII